MKKITILATACVIIVVVVFFEFYVFKTSMQQTTTVSIITNDPSAWVNRSVVVEGNINLFMNFGSSAPPWNYVLKSNETFIGVFWLGNSDFLLKGGKNWVVTGVNVTVIGDVTKGYWYRYVNGTAVSRGPVTYFIEAETINSL